MVMVIVTDTTIINSPFQFIILAQLMFIHITIIIIRLLLRLAIIEEAPEEEDNMTERICDCGMPSCMDCFMYNYNGLDQMGLLDKEDAIRGIELQSQLIVEDEVDEQLRSDQYPNGDGW